MKVAEDECLLESGGMSSARYWPTLQRSLPPS